MDAKARTRIALLNAAVPMDDIAALAAEAAYRQGIGEADAAMAAWQRVVSIVPSHVLAWVALGDLQLQTGATEAASASYARAVALNPYHLAAQFGLGLGLRAAGRDADAVAPLERAVALSSGDARAQAALGAALWHSGEAARAMAAYEAALARDPGDAMSHFNRGIVLQVEGRRAEAIAAYRAALALRPGDPVAIHNNLGVLLAEQDDFAEAELQFARQIALAPADPTGHLNLGVLRHRQQRLDEAFAALRTALALQPDNADVRANLAMTALLAGDLHEGFALFEARWEKRPGESAVHRAAAPRWDGQTLAPGQTLLVYAEQGYGDTLQFIRFAQLLVARGMRVIIEVQPAIASFITDQVAAPVFAAGTALPHFDAQIALLSLPRALATTLETIPAAIPYLAADPARTAVWRDRLAALTGLRVGLVWSGEPRPEDPVASQQDRRRSIGLARLAPLADIAGVDFVSLQLGAPALQAKEPPGRMVLHDWTAELRDFRDTAALVSQLDLVISVDTAVAHLASGLGRPVWLLNRFDTCWRWLLGRDDSPWYPTLRQFRQPAIGDWDGAVASLRAALATAAG